MILFYSFVILTELLEMGLDEWLEQNASEGKVYFCYDSANINCVADGVSLAEIGHAKDDSNKP